MKKLNLVMSLLLAALMLFGQIGAAQAAPAALDVTPEPPLAGTIQDIHIMNLATANPYVLVELKLEDGTIIKVKLSLEKAEELVLIIKEGDKYIVDETKLDPEKPTEIEFAAEDVLPQDETEDGMQHPIGVVLEMFFGEDLGLDYDAIMAYQEDGVGFGVLAQAMWMTKNIEGDSLLLDQIIAAKQSGDYSAIVLPDGSTPTNWGQLRKATLDKGNNLGSVKSGKADDDTDKGMPEDKDKDKDKDKGNGNGKGKGNGKGNNNP